MPTKTQSKNREGQSGSLAGRLRRIRRGRNLTQTELAKKAGISIDAESRLELGKAYPHPRTVEKLAEALEVEVERLTGGV